MRLRKLQRVCWWGREPQCLATQGILVVCMLHSFIFACCCATLSEAQVVTTSCLQWLPMQLPMGGPILAAEMWLEAAASTTLGQLPQGGLERRGPTHCGSKGKLPSSCCNSRLILGIDSCVF